MVECREIDGFQYLNKQTYSCNEKEYTVEEYLHTRTGMEFVLIPEGCFSMKNKNSCPSAHKVEVPSFLISKYVITQGVWKDVTGTEVWNDDGEVKDNYLVKEGKNYPVVYVSWDNAVKFCEKVGLCLPTEVQWEYACKAGTDTVYYWGDNLDEEYLWYSDNTDMLGVDEDNENGGNPYAHEVGKKRPNAFGLHDMSGNVWEWCNDRIEKTSHCVIRGGSWQAFASHCSSTSTDIMQYWFCSPCVGFRPVKNI